MLVAAGGLAREAASAARDAGREVLGCLDDDESRWRTEVAPGLPVLGGIGDVTRYEDVALVVCAGRGEVRERLVGRLHRLGVGAGRFTSIIHPRAVLDRDTVLGTGAIILAGVVATAQVTIRDHVVCMPNVVLTHDDVIDSYATLCAGVVLGGNVHVGERAYLGMSCSVREGCTVRARAMVGMGAVVIEDVDSNRTWVGVPARPLPGT